MDPPSVGQVLAWLDRFAREDDTEDDLDDILGAVMADEGVVGWVRGASAVLAAERRRRLLSYPDREGVVLVGRRLSFAKTPSGR